MGYPLGFCFCADLLDMSIIILLEIISKCSGQGEIFVYYGHQNIRTTPQYLRGSPFVLMIVGAFKVRCSETVRISLVSAVDQFF